MKNAIIFTVLVISTLSFAACPSKTLVKKLGAKTHYSLDLKTKFSESDFNTYGCRPETSVMSREQVKALLEAEYKAKLTKI